MLTSLLLVPIARAHIEAAELAADIVWDRTSAKMDLRVAVRELINAEQPLDAVVLPDFNQDPNEVAKRFEQEVLSGFSISYDGKPLEAKLVGTSIQNLVIGVSEEDIVPRTCAVYSVEFTGATGDAGPGRIDLSMSMFKLPLDAGFQPTVLCMVTHRLAEAQNQRMVVIGHEETVTLKPQWTGKASPVPAAPGAMIAKTADPVSGDAPKRSKGAMIVLALGAMVGIALVVVLSKKKV